MEIIGFFATLFIGIYLTVSGVGTLIVVYAFSGRFGVASVTPLGIAASGGLIIYYAISHSPFHITIN